jgi:hypothetical protein
VGQVGGRGRKGGGGGGEPEWEKEVAEDVRDECSKFGEVLHLHVDKNSQVPGLRGGKGGGCRLCGEDGSPLPA